MTLCESPDRRFCPVDQFIRLADREDALLTPVRSLDHIKALIKRRMPFNLQYKDHVAELPIFHSRKTPANPLCLASANRDLAILSAWTGLARAPTLSCVRRSSPDSGQTSMSALIPCIFHYALTLKVCGHDHSLKILNKDALWMGVEVPATFIVFISSSCFLLAFTVFIFKISPSVLAAM